MKTAKDAIEAIAQINMYVLSVSEEIPTNPNLVQPYYGLWI